MRQGSGSPIALLSGLKSTGTDSKVLASVVRTVGRGSGCSGWTRLSPDTGFKKCWAVTGTIGTYGPCTRAQRPVRKRDERNTTQSRSIVRNSPGHRGTGVRDREASHADVGCRTATRPLRPARPSRHRIPRDQGEVPAAALRESPDDLHPGHQGLAWRHAAATVPRPGGRSVGDGPVAVLPGVSPADVVLPLDRSASDCSRGTGEHSVRRRAGHAVRLPDVRRRRCERPQFGAHRAQSVLGRCDYLGLPAVQGAFSFSRPILHARTDDERTTLVVRAHPGFAEAIDGSDSPDGDSVPAPQAAE